MTARHTQWDDALLLGGARGARDSLRIEGGRIGFVVAGRVAQATFDACMLPRHIGPYAGAPVAVPGPFAGGQSG